MQAGGAKFRGFLGLVQIAAIDAAPDDDAVALEDLAVGEILPEVVVALLVLLLGVADLVPEDGDLLKAFFAGESGCHDAFHRYGTAPN